jgi:hypothetical protein
MSTPVQLGMHKYLNTMCNISLVGKRRSTNQSIKQSCTSSIPFRFFFCLPFGKKAGKKKALERGRILGKKANAITARAPPA